MKNNQVQITLIRILFINLLVAIVKIVIGFLTRSSAILADGFHSTSDASGNIIGLITTHYAQKPVDDNHPYGHAKIEMLGSLVIVLLLVFLGFEIISSSIDRFLNPYPIKLNFEALMILLTTILINIFVFTYEYHKGVHLNSTILKVDAMHTKTDVFISSMVLLSSIVLLLGFPYWIDTFVSILIALNIFYIAYQMFLEISPILLDEQVIKTQDITQLMNHFPQIVGIHKLRSRSIQSSILVDMHVVVDPNMRIESAHQLSHDMQDFLSNIYTNNDVSLVCHFEPKI
jgi:cation diffusion facilitator family transporter